jgi:hypothetical protein
VGGGFIEDQVHVEVGRDLPAEVERGKELLELDRAVA